MFGCLFHSCTHHGLRGEDVGVVLVDELLHSLLPHLEHLGPSVLHQGELLQHDFLGSLDLFSQVELGRVWLRLILLARDISADIKMRSSDQPVIKCLRLLNRRTSVLVTLPSCVTCARSVIILGAFFRLLRGAGVPTGISRDSAENMAL